MLTQHSKQALSHHSNDFTILVVRHVACSLLYCYEPETPTEGVIRKQILVKKKILQAPCVSVQHYKRTRSVFQCLIFTDGQQNREDLAGLQKSPDGR